MVALQGFPPLADGNARSLILGSMPGARSLAQGEYYAHPQNAFWRILADLLGFDAAAPYPQRCAALRAAGIAVWDVLARCSRASSLDADIVESSIVVNDFAGFLAAHPHIAAIHFNGGKAEASYLRYVLPGLPAPMQDLPRLRLPSTSPAHAAMSVAAKRTAWRAVVPNP